MQSFPYMWFLIKKKNQFFIIIKFTVFDKSENAFLGYIKLLF